MDRKSKGLTIPTTTLGLIVLTKEGEYISKTESTGEET